MGGTVRLESEGPIGWLIFDHPERRNAISADMWAQIPEVARELDRDPELRVGILRGAGEVAFISGADISEFEERRSGGRARDYDSESGRAFAALSGLTKPLLAAIRGFCVGGGVAVSLSADLRYAAEDAVFAIPAARLGLGYAPAGIESLIALVGPSVAKEIFFTARRFPAREALAKGLLSDVVPPAELFAHVREVALQIAANAPLTVRSVKKIVRELGRAPAERDARSMEASVRACFESEDYREGVRAFLEKRAAKFQGR